MTKTIEIPDIAQWEENDSELAKYKIQALNGLVNSYKRQNEFLEASIKHIEQVNTDLYKRLDKAIEYIINETTYSADDEMDKLLDILRGKDNE